MEEEGRGEKGGKGKETNSEIEPTTFQNKVTPLLIGWEGGKPTPRLLHHRRLNSRAFGASIRASDKCPSKQNCGYATEWVVMRERQFLSLPRAAKLQNPPLIKYIWMNEKER